MGNEIDFGGRRRARVRANRPWSEVEGWSPDLLKSQVYEQLLFDVILSVLPPGSRLDEEVLTRRYRAGLSGVREALGRLSLEGLVVRRARAGTTVAPLDISEARQILEVRRLIEPHAAALAAEHASVEDIEDLREAFDGAEAALSAGDRGTLILMDQDFHFQMARACGNPTLARILSPLQRKSARFWACSIVASNRARTRADVDAYRAVVGCVAERDAEGARAAVLRTLRGLLDGIDRMAADDAAPVRSPIFSVA